MSDLIDIPQAEVRLPSRHRPLIDTVLIDAQDPSKRNLMIAALIETATREGKMAELLAELKAEREKLGLPPVVKKELEGVELQACMKRARKASKRIGWKCLDCKTQLDKDSDCWGYCEACCREAVEKDESQK